MMVTVATAIDAPLMLRIPKTSQDNVRTFSILGLGDIVIPGMMLALALRFDHWIYYVRKQTTLAAGVDATTHVTKAPYVSITKHWGSRFWIWIAYKCTPPWSESKIFTDRSALARAWFEETTFPKRYFTAGIVGYVLGLGVTQIVVEKFQRGQPALLYLVPGVLGALWGTGLIRGELKEMYTYTDEVEASNLDASKTTPTETLRSDSWADWFGESFFSQAKTERNARRLGLQDNDQQHQSNDGASISDGSTTAEQTKTSVNSSQTNSVVYFGLDSPYALRQRSVRKKESEEQTRETGTEEPAGKRQRVE
jgi:minor histocompatibility antigen H13